MDYKARYYDPYLARFVSADTIVPSAGNPQSLNRFSYVVGNPLKYIDPSGHRYCVDVDENGRCTAWENSTGDEVKEVGGGGAGGREEGSVHPLLLAAFSRPGQTMEEAAAQRAESLAAYWRYEEHKAAVAREYAVQLEEIRSRYYAFSQEQNGAFGADVERHINAILPILEKVGMSVWAGGELLFGNSEQALEDLGFLLFAYDGSTPVVFCGGVVAVGPYGTTLEGGYYKGYDKPWRSGATPHSAYTQFSPSTGLPLQTALYDADGNVIVHIDYSHGTPGHWHYFTQPGNPAWGHGPGAPHYDPIDPYTWGLPSDWNVSP